MAEKPSPVDEDLDDLAEDDGWSAQDNTPQGDEDSEQSESEETSPEPTKAEESSESETELRARVQQLEERLAEREAQRGQSEEEEDDIEKVNFEPGDLPADYIDLKDAFKETGTYLARNTEQVRRELRKEIASLRQELRAVTAQSVRETYKLDQTEEQKVAAFAADHGFQYDPNKPAQVKKVVELYRTVHAKPKDSEPTKKTARPTPRPRPTSTSARVSRPAERASRIASRRDAIMRESFDQAIRRVRGR